MLAVYMTPQSTFPDAFPSNSLFGAICRGMEELGDDPGTLISAYAEKPPFFISSCFPFIGKNNPVPLFPMPFLPMHTVARMNYDTFKDLKEIRWVDEKTFQDLVNGTLTASKIVSDWKELRKRITNGIIFSSKAYAEERSHADIPHNQIHRLSGASAQFYYSQGTHYKDGGLWFLLDFADPTWEKPVKAALRLLADEGLGPRRSTGQGSFAISFSSFPDLPHADEPFLITLSRFIPDNLEMFGGQIWYELVTVRGRTQDGFSKKQVFMLSEGTFFKNMKKPAYGQIVRARENPPMVEYGVAFTVGMRCMG